MITKYLFVQPILNIGDGAVGELLDNDFQRADQ